MASFGKQITAGGASTASVTFGKKAASAPASRLALQPAYAAPVVLQAGKPVWGRRVIAALIDAAVFIIPLVAIVAAMGPQPGLTDDQFALIYWGGFAALLTLNICYFIGMEASGLQATLGKMAVGAIVTDKTGGKLGLGAVILRNTVGKLVSGLTPLYLGYLIGAARADRRCLHDLIAGTMVCARGKPSLAYDQASA